MSQTVSPGGIGKFGSEGDVEGEPPSEWQSITKIPQLGKFGQSKYWSWSKETPKAEKMGQMTNRKTLRTNLEHSPLKK